MYQLFITAKYKPINPHYTMLEPETEIAQCRGVRDFMLFIRMPQQKQKY